MKDPYEVLGLSRGATQDDIKKAYRKLARTLHPDLNPGDRAAEDKFKQITAANDFLTDPVKKARYDSGEIDPTGAERRRAHRAYGNASKSGKSRFEFGGDVDEILAEMLRRKDKGRGGWWSAPGDEGPRRGGDAKYSLRIGFAEAATGATKRISLPNGKSLDVRIPPGTEDGQTLRLRGQGHPGAGGEAGDALVDIKVDAHPFFTRQDRDILIEVPVTLQEAVLGGKITVPTVDGRVTLTVPAGSNTGNVLRLKGKGVPGKPSGDQLVKLKVMLPEKPDEDLSELVRQWAEKHPYDVRGKVGMG